jgi:hypothetical protein
VCVQSTLGAEPLAVFGVVNSATALMFPMRAERAMGQRSFCRKDR